MLEKKTLCPLKYLTNSFGGKWKMPVICILSNEKPQPQFNEVPPHVEYSLTKKGKRALPMLTSAAEWALKEMGFENLSTYCSECAKL